MQSRFQPKMLNSFGVKSLLKLIYVITKFSGFLFLSVDFTGARLTSKLSPVYILTSVGFSLYALTYGAQFDIAGLTRSKLLGIGMALIVKLTFVSPIFNKILYFLKGKSFHSILWNFQSCNLKVCNEILVVLLR
jgi:hypothetical protein